MVLQVIAMLFVKHSARRMMMMLVRRSLSVVRLVAVGLVYQL